VTDQQYMFYDANKFNSVLNFRGSVAKSARKYLLYTAGAYAQQSCLDGCSSAAFSWSSLSCYDPNLYMFAYTSYYTVNGVYRGSSGAGRTGAQGTRDLCGVCGGDDTSCRGCTDSTATNYDPDATQDDGSCVAAVPGCTDSTYNNYDSSATVDDGSCACEPGKVRANDECQNAATFRSDNRPVGANKKLIRKTWRNAIKPTRDPAKSKRANMARLPVTKDDLSDAQKRVMDKYAARSPVITVATEQSTSSTDINDCHYDIEQEDPNEKEILMPYDEGHYAFVCSGQTFVARQQETADGTRIACWEDSDWGQDALVEENTICNDVSIEIGSVTSSCTADVPNCCDECGVCDDDPTNDGSTCAQPTGTCETAETATQYQSLGCCEC